MTKINPETFMRAVVDKENKAKWMHERVVRSIVEFENKLDVDQEVGARLVNFSNDETIAIDDVGFWGPDIIKFYGKNAQGNPVELIQHISQLSVLLVAIKVKNESPKRIGFTLSRYLADGVPD
ncbi:hypothetical protein KHC28_11300 [Ancylobacter sonchi]|uniref:DUF6173 family protein n=1 Tax=Ancylobacter sonchi TaxID=1937790 RepID=UPI001BD65B38|nr:DUF6173 family protein [Ancylobacter sonchi]MBS7534244.1 hypothetical protein [Ancylobacter sonchi]